MHEQNKLSIISTITCGNRQRSFKASWKSIAHFQNRTQSSNFSGCSLKWSHSRATHWGLTSRGLLLRHFHRKYLRLKPFHSSISLASKRLFHGDQWIRRPIHFHQPSISPIGNHLSVVILSGWWKTNYIWGRIYSGIQDSISSSNRYPVSHV